MISFTLGDIHPHDLGTIVDHYGVALRTGHHCTMPVMQFFGVPATARASFGLYNTVEEVDVLVDALEKPARCSRYSGASAAQSESRHQPAAVNTITLTSKFQQLPESIEYL